MKQQRGQFWTAGRMALASFAFAAVALAASGCTSRDTANVEASRAAQSAASDNKPKITITTQTGAKPPQQPQQTASNLQMLPPEVLDVAIEGVDGKSFRLSDYKNKVVVLNLWATWCGPCRMEIPHLVELSREYGGKGVEFIGLTTENPETDSEKVRDFAKEFKINYKLGWADANMARSLMQGNYSIPQSFVITPGGKIQTKFRGFSPKLPDMIRAALDKAAEQTAGD